MITPPTLAWSIVVAGVLLSVGTGYGARQQKGCALVFVSIILAGCLAIGLSFLNGLLYGFCVDTIKICDATTDITVWSLSYPLLAAPLYWVAMVLSSFVGEDKMKSEEASDSNG